MWQIPNETNLVASPPKSEMATGYSAATAASSRPCIVTTNGNPDSRQSHSRSNYNLPHNARTKSNLKSETSAKQTSHHSKISASGIPSILTCRQIGTTTTPASRFRPGNPGLKTVTRCPAFSRASFCASIEDTIPPVTSKYASEKIAIFIVLILTYMLY